MSNRPTSQESHFRTRLKIAGFCLAAVGLIAGGLGLDQMLTPLWNAKATGATAGLIATELVACGILTGFGFALQVLGADPLNDPDEDSRHSQLQ